MWCFVIKLWFRNKLELPRPALVCLRALILQVQDIIIERTKETSISSTCGLIPSTTIADVSVYTMYLVHTMQAYPPNTGSMLGQRRSPLLVQCRSIVFDSGPTLKQNWVIVPCLLWLPYGWRFTMFTCMPRKATTWITRHIWANCEIMLDHRLRRWANIIPTKTKALKFLTTNIIFLKSFLNTKVLKLGTSNVILHMFIIIRTGVQKCQPFPTHSKHPSFP